MQLRDPQARYDPKRKARPVELTPHFDRGLACKNGYADKWRTYEPLRMSPGVYYSNTVQVRRGVPMRGRRRGGAPAQKALPDLLRMRN